MKLVKVHSSKSINFTKSASFWCEMTNLYKKCYPKHSFKRMADHLGLSETNARRYYYGVHHYNGYLGQGYTQMRQGACVTLWQLAQEGTRIASSALILNKSTNHPWHGLRHLWHRFLVWDSRCSRRDLWHRRRNGRWADLEWVCQQQCDSLKSGTRGVARLPKPCYSTFVPN